MIFLASDFFDTEKVSHGFSTRIESGSFDTIGSQETAYLHLRNRIAASFHLDRARVKALKQIHSNIVVTIKDVEQACGAVEADALVSRCCDVLLVIQTADCVPILFCDENNLVIGAAHAGWRGAFAGVIQNTVNAMKNIGADRIKAVLGPCIRQENYEVDAQFFRDAICNDARSSDFFIVAKREGHHLFDLPGYCCRIMSDIGVEFEDSAIDTYSNHQLFFSYRRSCHQSLMQQASSKTSGVIRTQTSSIMLRK